jgi:hypothetical protein
MVKAKYADSSKKNINKSLIIELNELEEPRQISIKLCHISLSVSYNLRPENCSMDLHEFSYWKVH